MSRLSFRAAALLVLSIALPASAQFKNADDAVEYRQGAFHIMGNHFGRIGAMVQGKAPYDANDALANAEIVAVMSKLPYAAFPEGTSGTRKGSPKPNVWTERAKFDELAKKNSKDTGSAQNGGDLDFAKPESYVPEFGAAMAKLKKGEMTDVPVKTQFGWHIIRLDDTREAAFPAFDDVKAQIKQRLEQVRLQDYQESLRTKAKTDYKFSAR